MIVRRLLAGAVLVALAAPGAASASALHLPWSRLPASTAPARLPTDNGARVFARADGLGQAAAPAASASPAPAASPAPTATKEQTAKARAEFDAWQAGKIDLDRYVAEAKPQFSDAMVSQLSTAYLKPLGAVRSFTLTDKGPYQGMTVYAFRAACANGTIDELISWNGAGKIQFIFFRPPQ